MRLEGADLYHLEGLKELAKQDRKKALKMACQEFEAVFLYQLLKEMKDTVPEAGLFPKSFAREMYEDLYYQEIAREVARRGTGLGEMLYRQLAKHYGGQK